MFGTLGGPELFLIFVVALIVFGPRKLPEIGKSLGRMMSEFRRASNEFRSTIESEVESEKIKESMRIEAPKVKPVKAKPPSATNTEGGSNAASGADASSGASPTTDESDTGPETFTASPDAEAGSSPAPSAPSGEDATSPRPAAEAAPETVSRQPPAPAGEHS
jgi:Tat protein translocase TatB subunit